MFEKINKNSTLSGKIRSVNEDFKVDEIQQFEPSGKGEHVWLKIQKNGENTDWVAKNLAQIAEVHRREVSFAGMKDRNAITTQWFSIQMPGREAPDWQQALNNKNLQSVQVLEEHRHDRKLKRGALKGNQFKLIIREFQGSETELEESIKRIKEQGVPNYYGAQRFGHSGHNVSKAEQWFSGEFKIKDRNKRSIYLSAARSWIFNHVLSARVKDGSWNQFIDGDVYILNGSNSSFSLAKIREEGDKQSQIDEAQSDDVAQSDETQREKTIQRLQTHDIHPSGVLWGRGRLASQYKIEELESEIAHIFKVLSDGLEVNGLKQERRSLRLSVNNIECDLLDSHTFVLSFSLPQGTYATTVLSELGEFE